MVTGTGRDVTSVRSPRLVRLVKLLGSPIGKVKLNPSLGFLRADSLKSLIASTAKLLATFRNTFSPFVPTGFSPDTLSLLIFAELVLVDFADALMIRIAKDTVNSPKTDFLILMEPIILRKLNVYETN